jgi:hypothetical protein
MKKALLLAIIITIIFSNCNSHIDDWFNSKPKTIYWYDYLPKGMVKAIIKDSVSLKQAVDEITNVGINKYTLEGFYYTKFFPKDSVQTNLAYYSLLFDSLNFIAGRDIGRYGADSFFQFRLKLINLDSSMNYFWDSIVKREKLIEMPISVVYTKRSVYLKVPEGEENLWADKLKPLTIIDTVYFHR